MAYRDRLPLDGQSEAMEAAAAELGTRIGRVRALVVIAFVLAGIGLGAALYAILRDWQLTHRGAHMPYVTGMIAFVPTFGAALRLAPHASRLLVRWLTGRWHTQLAAKYALDREAFVELTSLLAE